MTSAPSVSTVPHHVTNRSLSPSTVPSMTHIHYAPREPVHGPSLPAGDKKRDSSQRYWSSFKYSRPNYGKIRSNAIKNISNPVKSVKKRVRKMTKPITKRMPSMPSMPRRPSMPSMSRPSMPSIPRPSMPSMPSLPWTGGSGSSGSEKERSDRSDVSDQENATASNKGKAKRYKSMMSKMKNPLRKKRKQMMQQQAEAGEDVVDPATGHGLEPDAVHENVNVDPQVLNAIPARLHKALQDLDVFSDDEADDHEEESALMTKNRNNPWFTPEIASIVKLCRKYRRKHHKSKTKKSELKEICRELEKRKRKLIRSAKQKWSGSQKANGSNDVAPTVVAKTEDRNLKARESGKSPSEKAVDGERNAVVNEDNTSGVDGEKIAQYEVVINGHQFDDGSIAMIVPGIDPPTPPLLTPDPPDPSIVSMNDDKYDPVYEIYLMLMREGNAGADATNPCPKPLDDTRDGDHRRV